MAKRKNILFINPAASAEGTPRYGLGVLSSILKQQGHDVLVADYVFSRNVPPVGEVLKQFKADVVCVSMFSCGTEQAEQTLTAIRDTDSQVPVICGGPHVSVAPEDFIEDTRIDYLVPGEAEGVISDVVENAHRQKLPVVIPRPPLPDVDAVPFPDYRTFFDYRSMRCYPLLTSRGCPYRCSYCAAGIVCSRKYRPRRIESVIEELRFAGKAYNNVTDIFMYDDGFNLNRQRGKELLEKILSARSKKEFSFVLNAGNFRADSVDDELLSLLKRLGSNTVWVGVESADQDVFNLIQKGETLQHIENACQLCRKHRMRLVLNFIIGLPGDSFEKCYTSIRFARKFRASRLFWSVLVVYKGTTVYDWFNEHGTIDKGRYPPAYTKDLFGISRPNAWTPDFGTQERLDAQRLARIVTAETRFWRYIPLLLRLWRKYKVPADIIFSYPVFAFAKIKCKFMQWLGLLTHSPKLFALRLKHSLTARVERLLLLRRRVFEHK